MCLIRCVCYTLPGHHWSRISNQSLNHTLWNGCQDLNLGCLCVLFHDTVLTKPWTNIYRGRDFTKKLKFLDFCRKYVEMVTNGCLSRIWVDFFLCKSRKIPPICTVTIIIFKIFLLISCLGHSFSLFAWPTYSPKITNLGLKLVGRTRTHGLVGTNFYFRFSFLFLCMFSKYGTCSLSLFN